MNTAADNCASIYPTALACPILPDAKAHAVTAGLKCPPEIFPPNEIAIASADTINRGAPVKDTAPTRREVPKNSTSVGENIYTIDNKVYIYSMYNH